MATAPLIIRTPKASTQSVRFEDGMIVTAEDLTLATRYPLELLQVLVRAYLGCGVVCGLSLRQDARIEPRQDKDGQCPPENATYIAEIAPGVALDCAGYPLEVCGPVRIDLMPDPCGKPGPIVGNETRRLHIAVRRAAQPETGPAGGCGCASSDDGCGDRDAQCRRVRDHVEIGVFEELPEEACRRPQRVDDQPQGDCQAGGNPGAAAEHVSHCDCLTECSNCHCCGDNWVALGSVTIDKWGIVEDGIDHDTRRYVKPTECVCTRPERAAPPPSDGSNVQILTAKLDEYRAEQERRYSEFANSAEERMRRLEAALKEQRDMIEAFRARLERLLDRPEPPVRGGRSEPAASKRSGGAQKPGGGKEG